MVFTDPAAWPGFSDQPPCIRDRFTTSNHPDVIKTLFGCADWACVCNHYTNALPTLTSFVSNCEREVYTTFISNDVAAATSIFYDFCSQLPGVTSLPPQTTSTPSSSTTSSLTIPSTTSSSTSSSSSVSNTTSQTITSISSTSLVPTKPGDSISNTSSLGTLPHSRLADGK